MESRCKEKFESSRSHVENWTAYLPDDVLQDLLMVVEQAGKLHYHKELKDTCPICYREHHDNKIQGYTLTRIDAYARIREELQDEVRKRDELAI